MAQNHFYPIDLVDYLIMLIKIEDILKQILFQV